MTYEIDIPGFTAEQISVTTQHGRLQIEAVSDRRNYKQKFTLPRHLDLGTLTARLENGVLSLTVDEKQECKPRQIPVLGVSMKSEVPHAATQNLQCLS